MRAGWILLLAALPAFGQSPGAVPLSLKKAIEIALAPEGNTRVELAEELVKQAETRQDQARAALLPNLDGYFSYSDQTRNLRAFGINIAIPIPGFAFPTLAGPFSVLDFRANLTQSVFDFSSIKRYQASKGSVETAKKEKDSARVQVTDQVARAYLNALRAEAHLETARSNVDLAEALRKLAVSQKDAGTGTGIEVTRADVQLSNEKQRLLVAGNDRDKAHLQLLRALGLKMETKLALTDKLHYEVVEPVSYDQAFTMALKERADWMAQQKREDTAKMSYTAVKMERLPSVAAVADYGTIGPGFDNALPTRTYGVQVRIPVFDGGRRDARRAEGASQMRQEKIRTRDLREQVELEIRLALESLQSAEAQVTTAREGLRLAENELAQAQRRYKAGVANSVEVTDAQTRLERARDNQVNALFAHNLARLDLGSAVGVVDRYLP
jgi:outer membrane protein